jgi:hypothetical protein
MPVHDEGMPIYEYHCECGARLESLDKVSDKRERCAELCIRGADCASPSHGSGHVERLLSGIGIRGDGREAKEPVFDPCKRSNRPGGGCDGHEW